MTMSTPLFLEDWWMDAVCVGKHWERIAGMPCLLRERAGWRYILMPQQTQIAGATCPPDESKQRAQQIADALRERRLDYYFQHFPIGSPLPEQLAELGFTIRPHTTYRIEDLSDLGRVEHGFSENKRRQIRKAAALEVVTLSPDEFYSFHADCLRRQGKTISYSHAFFHSLDAACNAHNARHILALQDPAGELHAAAYLVYDEQTCYYLIPCYAPQFGSSGAGARIVAESIRFAAKHSCVFDFEGSMIPGVANHYAQFGSTPAFFYEVEKVYNPLFVPVLRAYKWLTRKQR